MKTKRYKLKQKPVLASEPPLQYSHSSGEGSLTFEKVWKMFQETDKKFQETREQFKETREQFKETDKRLDKQFQETDKKIKELATLFTGQWGKLVEALMSPGCLTIFRKRGIAVLRCHPNVTVENKEGRKIFEIDLLLINTGEIVVVEIKTTAKKEDVDEHIERIAKFKQYFPEYQSWKIYAAIGALVYTNQSDTYAQKNGFFVLKATGEGLVTIQNPPEFRPAQF